MKTTAMDTFFCKNADLCRQISYRVEATTASDYTNVEELLSHREKYWKMSNNGSRSFLLTQMT